jgi:hypothetical protein
MFTGDTWVPTTPAHLQRTVETVTCLEWNWNESVTTSPWAFHDEP